MATSQTLQSVATLSSGLVLRVIVPRMDNQPEVDSGIIPLDLLPAFHVHTTEIHLTNISPLASIRITSLPKVTEHMQVKHSFNF